MNAWRSLALPLICLAKELCIMLSSESLWRKRLFKFSVRVLGTGSVHPGTAFIIGWHTSARGIIELLG